MVIQVDILRCIPAMDDDGGRAYVVMGLFFVINRVPSCGIDHWFVLLPVLHPVPLIIALFPPGCVKLLCKEDLGLQSFRFVREVQEIHSCDDFPFGVSRRFRDSFVT